MYAVQSILCNIYGVQGLVQNIGIFFIPFIMVIFIVWFKSKDRRKRYELQAELYAKVLEKGQTLPTDLFDETKKGQAVSAESQKRCNPLNRGIICIAVGIGVSLFAWLSLGFIFSGKISVNEAAPAASLGFIPFFIGVAYVIIHFIEKKNDENEKTQ